MLDNRARSQHQQLPQAFVAGTADAAQTRPAGGRALARNQPRPGREMPRRSKLRRIDPQSETQCPDRPNSRDRSEPPTDRAEMRVVHVSRKIPIVSDRALPIATLPNAAFAAAGHHRRSWLAGGQRFHEGGFNRAPSTGVVGVAGWQGPPAMHVIGQHNPGVDTQGCAGARPASRVAQYVDLRHQQVRTAVTQVHRKEEGSARHPVAAILRRGRSMPRTFGKAECASLFRPTIW